MPLLRAVYHGLQYLRDPKKEDRERIKELIEKDPNYVQELKRLDPEGLDKLIGRDPKLFNKHAATDLKDLINNTQTDPSEKLRLDQIKSQETILQLQNQALNAGKQSPQNVFNNVYTNLDQGLPVGGMLPTNHPSNRQPTPITPEQEEIKKKVLGVRTTLDKKQDDLSLQQTQTGIAANQAQLKTAEQVFAENEAKRLEKERQEKNKMDILIDGAKSGRSLVQMYRTDPNARAKIMDSELLAQYNKEADEDYQNRELAIRKELSSPGRNMQDRLQAAEIATAQNLADRAGISVTSANRLLTSPKLVDTLTQKGFQPTTPEEKELQAGAQQLMTMRAMPDLKAKLPSITASFNKDTRELQEQIRSKKYSKAQNAQGVKDEDIPGMLAELNRIAATYYGPMGLKLEYGYGKEGDNTSIQDSHIPGQRDIFKNNVLYIKDASKELGDYFKPDVKEEKKPGGTKQDEFVGPKQPNMSFNYQGKDLTVDDILSSISTPADLAQALASPNIPANIKAEIQKRKKF